MQLQLYCVRFLLFSLIFLRTISGGLFWSLDVLQSLAFSSNISPKSFVQSLCLIAFVSQLYVGLEVSSYSTLRNASDAKFLSPLFAASVLIFLWPPDTSTKASWVEIPGFPNLSYSFSQQCKSFEESISSRSTCISGDSRSTLVSLDEPQFQCPNFWSSLFCGMWKEARGSLCFVIKLL